MKRSKINRKAFAQMFMFELSFVNFNVYTYHTLAKKRKVSKNHQNIYILQMKLNSQNFLSILRPDS